MAKLKNKLKARRAGIILMSAVFLLIVTLFLQWAFNKSEDLILPLAEQEFRELITDTVYDSVGDIDFDSVVTTVYTKDNKISSIKTDPMATNSVVTVILERLQADIGDEDIRIAIPIGDIVGDALSLGQGPDILVELNNYRSVHADIKSSFESAGVNQTIHRLTLELEVEAVLLLPGLKAEKVSASLALPVAETIIVGETPKTYISK